MSVSGSGVASPPWMLEMGTDRNLKLWSLLLFFNLALVTGLFSLKIV